MCFGWVLKPDNLHVKHGVLKCAFTLLLKMTTFSTFSTFHFTPCMVRCVGAEDRTLISPSGVLGYDTNNLEEKIV